jgi:hypothetical protein
VAPKDHILVSPRLALGLLDKRAGRSYFVPAPMVIAGLVPAIHEGVQAPDNSRK